MTVKFKKYFAGILLLLLIMLSVVLYHVQSEKRPLTLKTASVGNQWILPDTIGANYLPADSFIRYGKHLIEHTALYFGSKGSVAAITNGMNCQNCHLNAGTRLYGNNFELTASTYPKYRERSGRTESIEFRINECFQRSLNGEKIDSLSLEMRAMADYIKWMGKNILKGSNPPGAGTDELPYLERPADTVKGKVIFLNKCMSCHGQNGGGLLMPDSAEYRYPPLWGDNSFNVSAGMYRLSRLATFVKYNMPYQPTAAPPQLNTEEAWDVAAFIISQQRTQKFFSYDWPVLSTKPVDYPFGPYTDSFSELQHKYGPFGEIKKLRVVAKKQSQ